MRGWIKTASDGRGECFIGGVAYESHIRIEVFYGKQLALEPLSLSDSRAQTETVPRSHSGTPRSVTAATITALLLLILRPATSCGQNQGFPECLRHLVLRQLTAFKSAFFEWPPTILRSAHRPCLIRRRY